MTSDQSLPPPLTRLRTLLLDLARVLTLEEALDKILVTALDEEVDSAGVYLFDHRGAGRLAAHAGVDPAFVAAVESLQPEQPVAGVLHEGMALHWGIEQIAELQVPPTAMGPIRAVLAEPILVDGKAVGVVVFSTRSADQIAPEYRPYLGALAALAATAMLRAEARRDLERREALFRSLYQNAPLPYQSLDAAGNILEVNPAWEALFGYNRNEVLGHSITEYLDESSLPTLIKEFPVLQARGYVNGPEFLIHPKAGGTRRIVVNGRASYDAAGAFQRTHCVLTDVTEARRIDEETQALLAEKQLILDNVVVGLAVFRDRHFVACNSHFESLLGYQPGELLGQSAAVIHRDEDHFLARGPKIYAALSQGKNFTEEECFRRKDGSTIWLQVTGRASDPLNPSAEASVWIFVDLSERRQAEEEIRSLNASLEARVAQRTAELEAAMREMEAYSYSISHDLRAPLRAINGFTQLLQERLAGHLDAEEAAMFERIVRNTQKMGQLIDDILEYSRLGRETLHQSEVDLAALARAVVEELRDAQPDTRVEYGELPVVQGDPTMLRQILQNLIGNAFKYSAPSAGPVVRISGARINGEEIVSVSDNGVGFDMLHADKLFGMFQRLHPEQEFRGTGVGLAIVKRLVERHGGRVWADAEAGRGANFRFALPVDGSPPLPPMSQP